MPSTPGPQDGPSAAPRRPSLTDGAPASAGPHKQLSVLAALDGKPPASAARGPRGVMPWLLGLGGLAAVALVAAMVMRTPSAELPVPVQMATAPVAAPVSAPAPVAAPVAAVAPAPAASPPQVAAVEDLAPAAAATAVAAAAPALVQAAPKPAPARAKPKPAAERRAQATQQAQAKQRPNASKPTATATARQAKNAPTVAAVGAAAAVTAGAAAATSTNGDADVDLIAALVQHMNRQDMNNASRAETTIADLVGRCKSLAGEEALRCQRRICENYWGRADACPRSLAPRDMAVRP